MWNTFITLLRIEWLAEKRKRNTLPSLLLYLVSIYFIIYQINDAKPLDSEEVISVYWVIQLFIHVWLAFESMHSENGGRMLFWYQKISLSQFFVVKCVYNLVVTLLLSNLIWWACQTFLLQSEGWGVQIYLIFSLMNTCFILIFTFLAYIVFTLQKQLGLVSVLGIPLLIPTLMISMKLIRAITIGGDFSEVSLWTYLPVYGMLSVLAVASGLYLLPYLKHS